MTRYWKVKAVERFIIFAMLATLGVLVSVAAGGHHGSHRLFEIILGGADFWVAYVYFRKFFVALRGGEK